MQSLNLFNQNNIHIPYNLGKELGAGLDGQVFLLEDHPEKVIKVCTLFDRWEKELSEIEKEIISTLDFIRINRLSMCAIVYEWKWHSSMLSRQTTNGEQFFLSYYYVMERLNKISEDEKKVFHTILSHEDAGKIKNYSQDKLKNILSGLKHGLEFDENKIIYFCDQLQNSRLQHNDLHPRNIMKDNHNNFKLIDFDRCTIKEK